MLLPMSLARPQRARGCSRDFARSRPSPAGVLGYAIGAALLYDSLGQWLINLYHLG